MFDLSFVLVISIFALLAFIKGFIKSLFDVVNWILAALISYFLTPFVSSMLPAEYPLIVLTSVVGTVLFIVLLVIFSIITTSFTKTMLTVLPSSVDKSLGFAFGFAKGYFIFALIFVVITTIYSNDYGILSNKSKRQDGRVGPTWLVEAQSYKLLELGGRVWEPIINKLMDLGTNQKLLRDDPKALRAKITNKAEEAKETVQEKLEKNTPIGKIKAIKNLYDKNENVVEKGYDKKEIEKMNNLIEKIQ